MINNSRDKVKKHLFAKKTYLLFELSATHEQYNKLCTSHDDDTTKQSNQQGINNSRDSFKKHLFAKWNLRAAQIVCGHNKLSASHDDDTRKQSKEHDDQ